MNIWFCLNFVLFCLIFISFLFCFVTFCLGLFVYDDYFETNHNQMWHPPFIFLNTAMLFFINTHKYFCKNKENKAKLSKNSFFSIRYILWFVFSSLHFVFYLFGLVLTNIKQRKIKFRFVFLYNEINSFKSTGTPTFITMTTQHINGYGLSLLSSPINVHGIPDLTYSVSWWLKVTTPLGERWLHSDTKCSIKSWFSSHSIHLGVHHWSDWIAH
jgi:hypothetical protein